MEKQITYQQIADYFIALSNEVQEPITNLKLQKLVYFVQAWYLAYKKEPLFDEDFQAWVHGPVLRDLYDKYSSNEWRPIIEKKEPSKEIFAKFDKDLQLIISEVVESYFPLTAYELERISHSDEPWIKARKGLSIDEPSNNVIEKEWMEKYYASLMK
ncbi:MAG TPA: DUF4065 domain-containing protein [Candidatus Woesebacteria bacterium]|nr:DUF4065 domain-containing protein [Candidatus Woesebacteria bacterium]